jgi:hypothetical protein
MVHGQVTGVDSQVSPAAIHTGQLVAQHRAIDEEIKRRHDETHGTDPGLQRLKREKLRLKDLIEGRHTD